MEEKAKISGQFGQKLKDKKIQRVGIISALITGILLAALAVFGVYVSEIPYLFLKILSALLGFIFGAAIGGGMGVWICELKQEGGHSY